MQAEPALCIDYTEETREALKALYEVQELGEKTSEGVEVCRRAIEQNPCGYTAWHLYFKILQALGNGTPVSSHSIQKWI